MLTKITTLFVSSNGINIFKIIQQLNLISACIYTGTVCLRMSVSSIGALEKHARLINISRIYMKNKDFEELAAMANKIYDDQNKSIRLFKLFDKVEDVSEFIFWKLLFINCLFVIGSLFSALYLRRSL